MQAVCQKYDVHPMGQHNEHGTREVQLLVSTCCAMMYKTNNSITGPTKAASMISTVTITKDILALHEHPFPFSISCIPV